MIINFEKILKNENTSKILIISGIILILFALISFLWMDISFTGTAQIKSEKWAQFGDFIGGIVGTIWALAGVVLFYIALTEQRGDFKTNREVLKAQTEALTLQIKEFEQQTQELKETRNVHILQTKTLNRQQFESTFFNLLNLHNNIVNSMMLKKEKLKYDEVELENANKNSPWGSQQINEKITVNITGRDCFIEFSKDFKTFFIENKHKYSIMVEADLSSKLYIEYFEKYTSELSHYFRNLYHLFKFIQNSDVENKNMYSSLVRAQLSNDELFLLFYNCHSSLGNEYFKPLVKDFSLLKNLNTKTFIEENNHHLFYPKEAYS